MSTLDLREEQTAEGGETSTRSAKTREYFRNKQRAEHSDEEVKRSIQKITSPRVSRENAEHAEQVPTAQRLGGRMLSGTGKMVEKVNPVAGLALSNIGGILGSLRNPLGAAKEKFGVTTVYLMITTAVFFDILIGIIDLADWYTLGLASLLVGSLFDLLALMTFTFWFKINGATFGKRRIASVGFGFIAKIIPFLDIIPDWTIAIFLSFLQESFDKANVTP